MPLPTLPTPPSRDDPANFSARADAFLAALPVFGDAANSLEQSLQMVATTGTSTTSLAIGTGSKTLTTQAGKAWVVGAFVYIASSASVANLMFGQITAYNSATGSLTVNVLSYTGSGTLAAWSIGLSAPGSASQTYSGQVSAGTFAINAAANVFWQIQGAGVVFNCDAYDYLSYDRTADAFAFFIGGTNRLYIDQYGPGRNDDASTANGLVRKSQMDAAAPPGAVTAFARSSAPTGWLKCNGAAVSRTTYAALFAAIGTAFGAGDGTTTFNLPDLRGEFLRGLDDGRNIDSGRSLGAQQPGTHGVNGTFWGLSRNAGPAVGGDFSVAQTLDAYVGGGAAAFQHQQVTITSPETRPRNVALLYCIKF